MPWPRRVCLRPLNVEAHVRSQVSPCVKSCDTGVGTKTPHLTASPTHRCGRCAVSPLCAGHSADAHLTEALLILLARRSATAATDRCAPSDSLATLFLGQCKAASAAVGRCAGSGGKPKAVAAWGMQLIGGTTTSPATPKDASSQARS